MNLRIDEKVLDGENAKKFEGATQSPNNVTEKVFVCNTCEMRFRRKASLTVHLNVHNLKTAVTVDESRRTNEKNMENTCTICYKRFTAKKNLLKHLRDVHKNFKEAERMVVKKIKCPEGNCDFVCRMMKDLREHIESIHKIKILKDTLEFPNESNFQNWKKEEESNTVSWFVTGRKKTTLTDGTKKQILYCHRTGHYSPKGFGKYRMRSVGSCKIGVTCPASMEVLESPDGQLSITYYKTHLGHDQDVVYLKLSREERANLAEKINQGFTFDSILEDIKEGVDTNSNVKTKRIHLLSKKDLYSIMRSSHGNQEKKCSRNKVDKKTKLKQNSNEESKKTETGVQVDSGIDHMKEEEFEGNIQQNFTLYPGESVILPQDYRIIPKSSKQPNFIETTGDRISNQIVILSRDVDCTSVAEIILLPAGDTVAVPAKIIPEPVFADRKEPLTQMSDESHAEDTRRGNKMILKEQIKGKVDKIYELLPRYEYLTPKQFSLITAKLDAILNIFETADAKAKSKLSSKRKTLKRQLANE